MTSTITAKDLEAMLGDVDALIVERIVATQATVDEVAEALAEVKDDRLGEPHPARAGRVAEVREILDELLDDGDDEPPRD